MYPYVCILLYPKYGVALISRIDKIMSLLQKSLIKATIFCKRDL